MNEPMPAMSRMFSPESEQAIIGGLLQRNDYIDIVSEVLYPEHFADETMRLIYAEACSQIGQGKACDVVSVYEGLQGRVELATIGQIAQYTPAAGNMRAYANIVVERAKSRQLAAASMEINDIAHDTSRGIDERLEAAQATLAKLESAATQDEWVGAHAAMIRHIDVLEAREAGRLQRWATGLADLDKLLDGGFCPGDLVIIGARPSHGKTAMGMSIGLSMARQRPVAMLSMEMSHVQLNDRITAILGRVPLPEVIRPNGKNTEMWGRVVDATEQAKLLQWSACDTPGLNINQVRAKARALKRKQGLDVLIVDYIGLMAGLDQKLSRAYQLEEVSRGLKSLAKELQCVVLCLAQLNRQADELPYDAMPTMSHLRDCGAIEQDADVVMLLKRPIVCKPELQGDWQNYAKLAVAKSRQGATGIVHLHYHGSQTRFDGWAGDVPQRSASAAPPAKRGFQGGPD